MSTSRFTHWKDGHMWIGYLVDFPDYWTQGETLDDLTANLAELRLDISSGRVR